jgi:ABC-type uncharacterized transport system permease subunit
MVPLDLYPEWLRALALALPLPALLYLPAQPLLGAGGSTALVSALQIALWCAVAAVLLRAIYLRALRTLDVNGG